MSYCWMTSNKMLLRTLLQFILYTWSQLNRQRRISSKITNNLIIYILIHLFIVIIQARAEDLKIAIYLTQNSFIFQTFFEISGSEEHLNINKTKHKSFNTLQKYKMYYCMIFIETIHFIAIIWNSFIDMNFLLW